MPPQLSSIRGREAARLVGSDLSVLVCIQPRERRLRRLPQRGPIGEARAERLPVPLQPDLELSRRDGVVGGGVHLGEPLKAGGPVGLLRRLRVDLRTPARVVEAGPHAVVAVAGEEVAVGAPARVLVSAAVVARTGVDPFATKGTEKGCFGDRKGLDQAEQPRFGDNFLPEPRMSFGMLIRHAAFY